MLCPGQWTVNLNFDLPVLYKYTVNVDILVQYIFSRIQRSAFDARKYDASEKIRTLWDNRINS